ncbi:Lrp/AsnC family transcriptional regulator [Candidatus Woesearchaeota archaeon]|jgi:Lrp/AsnC family transcriptional regulator, leucine-responsive regulatory protein|nr:Lrp/AsnC family transcriptional regulator [Candidatus Woesearchaeota archaeon]MBT5272950.1 Lrp/AsnC family transcriptional regulator [Candidatus Woesearchaeota archaeon]MBT6041416.1 Lrp/AsnC family transcriptional regulator [Candidatus Woesearchaeota archaeon]MBT6337299.1 Lrp/AsnC family transcriptional regulator [Candidatus Woesearchaeota archaeon]MBT7927176.1 Lrp/AsnC family transcriptional regulator [Candidatus Woesearchaeota archaeon]
MNKKTKTFAKIDEYKKKTQFDEKLGLDERDNVILSMLQKNPETSQDEIAKKIKLSQPSVGARIRKLQEKGILHNVNGVNFKTVDLHLAKIDVNATDTKAIIDEFKYCPFFVNALVTSGRHNVCLFFTATDLKRLEGIVNHHLRGNPKVKEVEVNIVVTSAKDFVLPMNMDYEGHKLCDQDCMESID